MAKEVLQLTQFVLKDQIAVGTDYVVTLTIDNLRPNATHPTTKLWVVENKCLQPSYCDVGVIAPGAKKTLQLKHNFKGGSNFDTLEATTTYVIQENGKEVGKHSFKVPLYQFIGSVARFRPPSTCKAKHINVLLFGAAGCGKSSYLQSVITAMGKNDYPELGVTEIGGGYDHVTTRLRRFEVPGADFKLWDTWGLSPNNYVRGELGMIVKGMLPNQWEMENPFSANEEALEKAKKKSVERAIHALIVFLPCASLRNPKAVQTLHPLLEDVKRCGLNPIFLLALADEEVKADDKKKFRANPNASYPEIEAAMTSAANIFKIPKNRISVSCPYTEEKERIFELERLVCKTMSLALQTADGYLRYQTSGSDSEDSDDKPPAYKVTKPQPKVAATPPPAAAPPPPTASGETEVTLPWLIEQMKLGYLDADEFKAAKAKLLGKK